MPIYVYECLACEKTQEQIQKFSDPPPWCEECEEEMVKTFNNSGGAFVLKGSCWEKDGYTKKQK